MSTQMDTRRTGPLCVLRRNRPTKAVPEELRESAKPAESKLTRSNEWRNAYRRFSFIFDPFKRRAKSADPRANENGLNDSPFRSDFKTVGFNSNGTFNGFTDQNQPTDARTLVSSCPNQTNAIADWKSSDVVVCTVCSTPLTQPNLISVCGRSDPQTEQLYVSPVNITGQIFEHYRRTRGTANLIGPRTQLNGQMDLNYGRVTRQTGVGWIPTTNRPASFHPVLPQRDESNPPPHSHHNPYAYQNSYSSSEVTSQNGEQSHRSPYHSFRPEPTLGKPESGRKKSTMYDSLYDYPPTLSPFPCPTYRPDIGVHGRINARASFPMNPIRKRVTRPASINPMPTFTSSSRAVARPPTIPNLIGDFDSQWSNSRSHTHSVDRSRLTDLGKRHVSWENPVTVTTTIQTTTTTTAIKRNNNSVTSVYGFRSSSITDSELSDSLIQPVVYPHLVRSQSGDSSGAVCQVTVCHLAPKLCATVAETATRLQRRPKLSIPSRPRSTLVTSSDQLNLTEQVRSTTRPNVRPQPDTYLIPSRGSTRLSDSACGLLNGRDLKNPEWATCSNAASFSVRQRRELDHDRDQSNGTAYPANSVQRIRPAPPAETRSSSMSGRGIKNPNGFLDRQIGCACKVPPVLLVSSDQRIRHQKNWITLWRIDYRRYSGILFRRATDLYLWTGK
ncbi:hypothetical protein FGIG_10772 [Fasciola gigantica]|uniref:Uncharacterized protein n=1 Tax=Fasciola gigantica TaxID=46835 RepID=A0A504ZD97_FASGI|nr:hypothetical protein FGIG_10772 [Fasciola gigantica]